MTTEDRSCSVASLLPVTCKSSPEVFNHNPKTRLHHLEREKINKHNWLMNKRSISPSKSSRGDANRISENLSRITKQQSLEEEHTQIFENVAEQADLIEANRLNRLVETDPSIQKYYEEIAPDVSRGEILDVEDITFTKENGFSTSKELIEKIQNKNIYSISKSTVIPRSNESDVNTSNEIKSEIPLTIVDLGDQTSKEHLNLQISDTSCLKTANTHKSNDTKSNKLENVTRLGRNEICMNEGDVLVTMHKTNEGLESKTVNGGNGKIIQANEEIQNFTHDTKGISPVIKINLPSSSKIELKSGGVTDYLDEIVDNEAKESRTVETIMEIMKVNGNLNTPDLHQIESENTHPSEEVIDTGSTETNENMLKIDDYTNRINQDLETSCINKEIFKTKYIPNPSCSIGEVLEVTTNNSTEDNKVIIDSHVNDGSCIDHQIINVNGLEDCVDEVDATCYLSQSSVNIEETANLKFIGKNDKVALNGNLHSNEECSCSENIDSQNLRLNARDCTKEALNENCGEGHQKILRLKWALIEDTSPSNEDENKITNENANDVTATIFCHPKKTQDPNLLNEEITLDINGQQIADVNLTDGANSSHATKTSESTLISKSNDEKATQFIGSLKSHSEDMESMASQRTEQVMTDVSNSIDSCHVSPYTDSHEIKNTEPGVAIEKVAAENPAETEITNFSIDGKNKYITDSCTKRSKPRLNLNLTNLTSTFNNNQNVLHPQLFENVNQNSADKNDSSTSTFQGITTSFDCRKNPRHKGLDITTIHLTDNNETVSIGHSLQVDQNVSDTDTENYNQRSSTDNQTYDINKNKINFLKHAEELDLQEQVEELKDLSIKPEEIKIIAENFEQHALNTLSPDCYEDINFESSLTLANKENADDLALFALYIRTPEVLKQENVTIEVPQRKKTVCRKSLELHNLEGEESSPLQAIESEQNNKGLGLEIPEFRLNKEGLMSTSVLILPTPQVSINRTDTASEIIRESPSPESREFCADKDSLCVEEDERRVRRCSSLKTGKTPPGTPGRKKIVRFADVLGLDLADVRTFLDEIPKIPSSAYNDLAAESDFPAYSNQNLKNQRVLLGMFRQPGGIPNFLEKVTINQVMLENAVVEDPISFSIRGLVRVRNLDFDKQVHVRYSLDSWKTFSDLQAVYLENSCDGFTDKFTFLLYAYSLSIGQKIEFAIRFQSKGVQFWDNNGGTNYSFQCLPASNPTTYSPISSGVHDQIATFYYMESTTAQIHDLKEKELTNTAVQEYIMKSLEKNNLQSNQISKGELYIILAVLLISIVFLYIKMH